MLVPFQCDQGIYQSNIVQLDDEAKCNISITKHYIKLLRTKTFTSKANVFALAKEQISLPGASEGKLSFPMKYPRVHSTSLRTCSWATWELSCSLEIELNVDIGTICY